MLGVVVLELTIDHVNKARLLRAHWWLGREGIKANPSVPSQGLQRLQHHPVVVQTFVVVIVRSNPSGRAFFTFLPPIQRVGLTVAPIKRAVQLGVPTHPLRIEVVLVLKHPAPHECDQQVQGSSKARVRGNLVKGFGHRPLGRNLIVDAKEGRPGGVLTDGIPDAVLQQKITVEFQVDSSLLSQWSHRGKQSIANFDATRLQLEKQGQGTRGFFNRPKPSNAIFQRLGRLPQQEVPLPRELSFVEQVGVVGIAFDLVGIPEGQFFVKHQVIRVVPQPFVLHQTNPGPNPIPSLFQRVGGHRDVVGHVVPVVGPDRSKSWLEFRDEIGEGHDFEVIALLLHQIDFDPKHIHHETAQGANRSTHRNPGRRTFHHRIGVAQSGVFGPLFQVRQQGPGSHE